MYVKALHALIAEKKIVWHSITDNQFSLTYTPGVWMKPRLPGSRLFIYKNLMYALMHIQPKLIQELPFAGMVLWWCEAYDAQRADLIRDPPERFIRLFWELQAQGISIYKNGAIPFAYRFKQQPFGVLAAKMVRLRNLVLPEEIAEFASELPLDN